ncbi:transposase [Caldisericum sp.]|uniref:transposase n=1 Tax=Caldisericum sp. TaxID=2499687 RepID=UPI003D1259DF
MDNNDAKIRGGVPPTYKRVKGFQPLQVYWNGYLIDAVFRGGISINHSDTVRESLTHIIKRIRKEYRKDVPILVLTDAGFFNEDNFEALEKLNVAYISRRKSV